MVGPPCRRAVGEQFPHPELLLRRGQQPQLRALGEPSPQAAAERVHSGHRRLPGTRAELGCDRIAKVTGCGAAGRKHQRCPTGSGPGPAGSIQGCCMREHRGLAGARTAQKQQRLGTPTVQDGGLVGVQCRQRAARRDGHRTMQSRPTDSARKGPNPRLGQGCPHWFPEPVPAGMQVGVPLSVRAATFGILPATEEVI